MTVNFKTFISTTIVQQCSCRCWQHWWRVCVLWMQAVCLWVATSF